MMKNEHILTALRKIASILARQAGGARMCPSCGEIVGPTAHHEAEATEALERLKAVARQWANNQGGGFNMAINKHRVYKDRSGYYTIVCQGTGYPIRLARKPNYCPACGGKINDRDVRN